MIVYVNGKPRELPDSARLTDVLDVAPGESAPRGVAVALDGTVVPRADHAGTALHEGAHVDIVTAVQGG